MPFVLSSNPPPGDQAVTLERVVELLAPALGSEKSESLVVSTARELRLDTRRLTVAQIVQILETLGTVAGVVGVAARFARTRLLAPGRKHSVAPSASRSAGSASVDPASRKREANRIEPSAIALLLAQTLGTEKSRQIVDAAVITIGATNGPLEEEQALAVLDVLAKAPGIVGIASRFAKARLILGRDQT
jgi:hypothetical protein